MQKQVQDCCGSPAVVATVVHVCRVKQGVDQSKMKVCVAAGEHVWPVLSIVGHRLYEKGGKTLRGQAPKGGLQRDVQTYLKQLNDLLK